MVSAATAQIISGLKDATLRPLGDHALKDIEEQVSLHQVVAPGLEEDFPALRSVSSHPTNLPARLAPLIGRNNEISALIDLLSSDDVSVVTLVGPGGTGKTRVALALGLELLAAGVFSRRVFFVDLSSLSDPALVIPAIAQACLFGRHRAEVLLRRSGTISLPRRWC